MVCCSNKVGYTRNIMRHVAKILIQSEVVRVDFEQMFKWTSGIQSPIYCDCRELMSLPDERTDIVNSFLEIIRNMPYKPDAVAGTATAGIPWASFLAQELGVPLLYVRSKPKGHGRGKMVEGRLEKGKRVLVIEDAISTGGSVQKSVQALRDELNAEVTDVMSIFTWDTKLSHNTMQKTNVNLHSLTLFSEIVETLHAQNKVSDKEFDLLHHFHTTI